VVDTLPVVWIAATLQVVGSGTRSIYTINIYNIMSGETCGDLNEHGDRGEGSWGLKKRTRRKRKTTCVLCICVCVYIHVLCAVYLYDYYYYGQTDRQIDCILCFDASESEKWSMAAATAHARRGIIFHAVRSRRWNLCERKAWCSDMAHKSNADGVNHFAWTYYTLVCLTVCTHIR